MKIRYLTPFFFISLFFFSLGEAVSAAPCSFTTPLFVGTQSPDVLCLQQFLNTTPFPITLSGTGSKGNETTYFGLKTKQAVSLWQASEGLPASGFFGAISQAKYRLLQNESPSPFASPASSVSPSSKPTSSVSYTPKIMGVGPDHIVDGGVVNLKGEYFSKIKNKVTFFAGKSPLFFEIVVSTSATDLSVPVSLGFFRTIKSSFKNSGKQDPYLEKAFRENFVRANATSGFSGSKIPLSVVVQNEYGISLPFKIFVDVLP